MELTGEQRIAASRTQVWEALNDPEVLKQCIPGCEALEKVSDTEFHADVTAKVGPVKAKFKGQVTLTDLDPPNGYTLSGEGKGGAAGFGKGEAKVTLEEDGDATILRYTVDAKVGGKLAQIGSRLVDGTARKMADEFFTSFNDIVSGGAEAPAEEIPETVKEELEAEAIPALAEKAGKSNLLVWGLVAAAIVIIVLWYLSRPG
jgi:carbon monoxide dehydrogenase subunit G